MIFDFKMSTWTSFQARWPAQVHISTACSTRQQDPFLVSCSPWPQEFCPLEHPHSSRLPHLPSMIISLLFSYSALTSVHVLSGLNSVRPGDFLSVSAPRTV